MNKNEINFNNPLTGRLLKAVFLDELEPDTREINDIYIDTENKKVTIVFGDDSVSDAICLSNAEDDIYAGVAFAFLKAHYSNDDIKCIINRSQKKKRRKK